METVLVTGASGLLGQTVVAKLAKTHKYHVVAVVSGRRKVSFAENIQVEVCDLLEEKERIELLHQVRPNLICHLAWSLGDSAFLESENNLKWLEASLHIIRLFVKCGGRRFVFAGSSSEYGQTAGGCSENGSLPQYSLYGATKLAFEKMAELYCAQVKVSFASARYFSIYGPGDVREGRALPSAIKTMLAGEKFVCKAPCHIWDYIYVDDAASATELLLASDYCGAMNIASGRPISMREAFQTLALVMGCEDLLEIDDDTKRSVILTADIEKMKQILGFKCKTDFSTGITKTVQWWKSRGF